MRRRGGVGVGGILRKGSPPKKQQLLVFGYSCKLFRDDERALYVDQGKHLIPCMGDDELMIDRYDARGALGPKELSAAESCGSSLWERLSPSERHVEKLCDEERYRALLNDEDDDDTYGEEELERIHMSGGAQYGRVEFDYDKEERQDAEKPPTETVDKDDDEPFVPAEELRLPEGMALPETKKLNAIIEKTASFIASQGTQMEILLKAKQSKNPQFEFLSSDCPLHVYYCFLLAAYKEGRLKSLPETKEEKPEEDDHYLHPSLAPLSVESAPSIPSISYKPSADCAYSMLVNEIKGTKETNREKKEENLPVDPGLAPPGTEAFSMHEDYYQMNPDFSNVPPEMMQMYHAYYSNYHNAYGYSEISKAPIIYNTMNEEQAYNMNPYDMPTENYVDKEVKPLENYDATNSPKPEKNVLKLIHYSDSENDSDSDADSKSSQNQLLKIPPPDQQSIIDKMASYVARNGNDFEEIVKMKGDLRFSFLDTSHVYNPYYKHKRMFYERTNKKKESNGDNNKSETNACDSSQNSEDKKAIAPVSFSIKKMKEPEPILPKPALQYESSEEDGDGENSDNKKEEKIVEPIEEKAPIIIPEVIPEKEIKPIAIEQDTKPQDVEIPKVENPKPFNHFIYQIQPVSKEHSSNYNSSSSNRKRDHDRRSKRSSSNYRDEREEYRRKKRKKKYRSENDSTYNDVITIDEELESKSEYIDLTNECNEEEKYSNDPKNNDLQLERKRKVAAFLSSLKSVPSASTGQHNTLASAMVKTLHTLQTKDDESHSKRHSRRDDDRKFKKQKSDRRHGEMYSEEGNGPWKHSHRSRRSEDRYYKKSKRRRSSRDDRSDYKHSSRSRSAQKYPKDQSRSSSHRSSSPDRINIDMNVLKSIAERKISQKEDELSTTSLKELVRETRKEFTITQPIKMAVDIFANDTPDASKTSCASEDEWEKDSNDGEKKSSKSDNSSSDSSSSSED